MANTIATGLNVRTWALTTNRDAPLLNMVMRKLQGLLEPGQGDTVNVLTPGYYPVLRQESLQPLANTNLQVANSLANLRVNIKPTPVTVRPRISGAAVGMVDQTLRLEDRLEQIDDPMISRFISTIDRDIFTQALRASGTGIVGKINSQALSKGSAALFNLRSEGQQWGALNANIQTVLATDPNFRWLNGQIAERNYKGYLGNFVNTDFFNTQEAGGINVGSTIGASPTYSITGTVTPVTDGATTLTLSNITTTDSSITAIFGGTPFVIGSGDPTVDGSWVSSFFLPNGFSQLRDRYIRLFIAKPNLQLNSLGEEYDAGWPITSGNATVGIETVHLGQIIAGTITASDWPVANAVYVGNAAQASSQPIFCPLLTGVNYDTGVMATNKVLAFASATPREPRGLARTGATSAEGFYNIRVVDSYENISRQDTTRVEGLDGMSALYAQGGVALYNRQ